MNKKTIFGGLLLLLLAVGAFLFCRFYDPVVVTINNNKIRQSQFLQIMGSVKSDVINQYDLSQLNAQNNLWNCIIGNSSTAMDAWLETALADCIKTQVTLEYGFENNLVQINSFDGLQRSMQQENAFRRGKLERGEAVYGITEFSLATYEAYIVSNLEIKLKEMISQDPSLCDELSLREFYENNKAQIANVPAYTVLQCYSIEYQNKEQRNELYQLLAQLHALQIEDIPDHFVCVNITLSTESTNMNFSPAILQALSGLAENEYSDVFDSNSTLYRFYCEERSDATILSFEDAKALVKDQFVQELFRQEIQHRMDEATVKINRFALSSILWKAI